VYRDLWNPGDLSEDYIFDAGLSGCRHRDGIAIATETRRVQSTSSSRIHAAVYGWKAIAATSFVVQWMMLNGR
jgi:hypothetical protein